MSDPSPLPDCGKFLHLASVNGRPEAPVKSIGRPKTRTLDFYVALWQEYQSIKVWFRMVFGRNEASDVELLVSYFSARNEQHGLRQGRVLAPEFKAKLKTIRNELGKAKKLPVDVLKTPYF